MALAVADSLPPLLTPDCSICLQSSSKSSGGDSVAASGQLVELTARCAVVEEQKQSLQRQLDQQLKHAEQMKVSIEEFREKLSAEQLAGSDHRHAAEDGARELEKATAKIEELQERASHLDTPGKVRRRAAWSGTPIRDTGCCCRPRTGVPYLGSGPR